MACLTMTRANPNLCECFTDFDQMAYLTMARANPNLCECFTDFDRLFHCSH